MFGDTAVAIHPKNPELKSFIGRKVIVPIVNKEIPVIAGRTVEDFIISVYSYKLKVRRNPVMEMVAQRLTDEDIAALAAYFSTIK